MSENTFKLKHIFFGTYTRGFITSYLLFLFSGALLLMLPFSVQSGVNITFSDALFTSASALSTTGLSTLVVRETFTIFGLVILAFIIQFGGIGLIMMVALFWLVVRQKIGFKQRNMIMTDQNQLSRQGIVKFVKAVIIMIFIIEFIAFGVMSTYLYLAGYFPLTESLLQAFFLTISLFTNAGFDIAPNNDSFAMFSGDYFMQTLGMSLFFLGAVGFWPLAEFKEFIIAKFKREKFNFSVFVKVLVSLHVVVWLISGVIFYSLESDGFLASYGLLESVYYAAFMSLTTRNAGFSTMDVNTLGESTRILFMFLMFLGSSPNSAGGGIRTTTLFVVLLAVYSFARGKDHVIFNKKTIKHETVHKSLIAIIVAVIFVTTSIFVMSLTTNFALGDVVFEVFSAFGTTGLSLGITSSLNLVGKIILIVVMFVGRVGIIATLLLFKPKTQRDSGISYPETDFIVG